MVTTTDYLRDEVRSGFYIPTAIKQAWAAQLSVLSEIDRICKKHNITYFADWGTLLGTVRHGGYVPWDDDMDICMKREDYIRFKQVADLELPKEFAIHDYERKEDHWLFLSRVVNRNQICFEEEHLAKYNNFPYIAGIDIFVLDYLYRDEEKELERDNEVKHIIALADGIVENKFSVDVVGLRLSEIKDKYGVSIVEDVLDRIKKPDSSGLCSENSNLLKKLLDDSKSRLQIGIELYRLAEQQMARTKSEEADRIGQIFPWVLKGNKGQPKEMYDNIIELPFENITMPVPACYHKALSSRYGDYFRVHKVWSGHDYPYFEGQRANLQAVADFELPEFKFDSSMLERVNSCDTYSASLKSIALECYDELVGMINKVEAYCGIYDNDESGLDVDYETGLSLLADIQQLAVDLGTLVENVKGEADTSCRQFVSSLEEFCEAIFVMYNAINSCISGCDMDETLDNCMISLKGSLVKVEEQLKLQIISRKEYLFIAVGPKEWNGFSEWYEQYKNDAAVDVSVVAVPVMSKDIYGRINVLNDELAEGLKLEKYPDNVQIDSWDTYSLELHHPDKIFIQNPYDGENPCLTIPQTFYAKNLRNFTEELIYIPAFSVNEFTENDYTDIYNMKHYVTAPGVIYADKIFVQSENMKKRYVEKLSLFAGEYTRQIWEKKVNVCKHFAVAYGQDVARDINSEHVSCTKKRVLFCVGVNEIFEHQDVFINGLRDRFEIFKKNSDRILVDVCIYPFDKNEWMRLDDKRARKTFEIINEYVELAWCSYVQFCFLDMGDTVRSHDAYYGSASPLVHLFGNEDKPVMVADYGVDNH